VDEIDFMDMLRQDEEQWYNLLIDKYSAYVSAIIRGIAKGRLSAADMEEIAADVFFKIWLNREKIRSGSLKAYIAKITRNTAIDRLRIKGIEFISMDDDILQISTPQKTDELAIIREQTEIIETTVCNFKEPEREIFIRFYYFGESIQKISTLLEINPSTIKTKLHRLRLKLKETMQERGYGYES